MQQIVSSAGSHEQKREHSIMIVRSDASKN